MLWIALFYLLLFCFKILAFSREDELGLSYVNVFYFIEQLFYKFNCLFTNNCLVIGLVLMFEIKLIFELQIDVMCLSD